MLVNDGAEDIGHIIQPADIELVEMPEEDAFDVDYEWEFQLYEALYTALGLSK